MIGIRRRSAAAGSLVEACPPRRLESSDWFARCSWMGRWLGAARACSLRDPRLVPTHPFDFGPGTIRVAFARITGKGGASSSASHRGLLGCGVGREPVNQDCWRSECVRSSARNGCGSRGDATAQARVPARSGAMSRMGGHRPCGVLGTPEIRGLVDVLHTRAESIHRRACAGQHEVLVHDPRTSTPARIASWFPLTVRGLISMSR